MPTITLLCGIANAGKTSWIRNNLNEIYEQQRGSLPADEASTARWPIVVSSKRIRKDYARDHGIGYRETFTTEHNAAIQQCFVARLDALLATGCDIVVNHQAETVSQRAALLAHIREANAGYRIEAMAFPMTLKEALDSHYIRTRQYADLGLSEYAVPEYEIIESHKAFQPPHVSEGFDKVTTVQQGMVQALPKHFTYRAETKADASTRTTRKLFDDLLAKSWKRSR